MVCIKHASCIITNIMGRHIYYAMLWCWEDARRLHSKVHCVVCQKYEGRIHGMKHFYVLRLQGQVIKKTSNVMDHAIVSIVIAYTFINDCM